MSTCTQHFHRPVSPFETQWWVSCYHRRLFCMNVRKIVKLNNWMSGNKESTLSKKGTNSLSETDLIKLSWPWYFILTQRKVGLSSCTPSPEVDYRAPLRARWPKAFFYFGSATLTDTQSGTTPKWWRRLRFKDRKNMRFWTDWDWDCVEQRAIGPKWAWRMKECEGFLSVPVMRLQNNHNDHIFTQKY